MEELPSAPTKAPKPPPRAGTIYTLIVLGLMAAVFFVLFIQQHFFSTP